MLGVPSGVPITWILDFWGLDWGPPHYGELPYMPMEGLGILPLTMKNCMEKEMTHVMEV